MEKLDSGKLKDTGMNKFRKINADEAELILNWINEEYCVDYETIEELLDTDYDELSEIMYECAIGINKILHYDNHNIYIENL